jgi:acyl-homoserine lactone synthase
VLRVTKRGAGMIYLIDSTNRTAFTAQLEEMFEIRHRIYVEGRGWRALARTDRRECDQFDNEDAVYLLGIDDDGRVTSGSRLIPTTKPPLMRDVFPHSVTKAAIPQDPYIYEWTRYFLTAAPNDRYQRRTQSGELLCALFEYALDMRLNRLSVVCDTFFVPKWREAGWGIELLGDPTPYPEGTCIALLIEVSRQALIATKAARGIASQSLQRSPFPPVAAAARAIHAA